MQKKFKKIITLRTSAYLQFQVTAIGIEIILSESGNM